MIQENLNELFEQTRTGTGDSDQHLLVLFSIAHASRGKKYLELGVRDGRTTLPLLTAAYVNNGFLTSVDIKTANIKIPDELKECHEFIQEDAIKFLERQSATYDLVYIDDWHAYSHVKKELELIDNLITPSSVILIHDLMYGNTQPYYHTDLTLKTGQWAEGGPYRAVAELDTNFWEWSTLPWNNGLTILRKKYTSKR